MYIAPSRPVLQTRDFMMGGKVRYIPDHAHGDVNHPDCSDGFVRSVGEFFVFVSLPNTTLPCPCFPHNLAMIVPMNDQDCFFRGCYGEG